MKILKDLSELVEANVITKETAEKIQEFYSKKKISPVNRLFVVFGILGAILVGLGIILIIAHNWDELSRKIKTVYAFLPLLIGQVLCGYALVKKYKSTAWRESSSAFLFLAVGACISLVSQIYNIPGSLGSFLLTWTILCLPIIYVMRSSVSSLLYLIGITYYACETNYWTISLNGTYFYWFLLLSNLPHYYFLYKKNSQSNFMFFHNWMIPISLIITLGTLANENEILMFIAYFSLFGLLLSIGNLNFLLKNKLRNNGYKILGSLGTIIMLLILSFGWFWEELAKESFKFVDLAFAPEFYVSVIISLLATGLLYFIQKNKPFTDLDPLAIVFILFIITFFIGMLLPVAVILINLYVLAISILIIRNGARKDHLGILNFGLLIITALIVCRFFDTDLSFIFRGILFMMIGIGFFTANYWMLKNRKTNEQ